MASIPPLLDLGTARQLAQQYVGAAMKVVACWQPPQSMYFDPPEDCFYFAILERVPTRVGGTPHVAVGRRTGKVFDIGAIGE